MSTDPEWPNCKECNYFKNAYCFFHMRRMRGWELCPDFEQSED